MLFSAPAPGLHLSKVVLFFAPAKGGVVEANFAYFQLFISKNYTKFIEESK